MGLVQARRQCCDCALASDAGRGRLLKKHSVNLTTVNTGRGRTGIELAEPAVLEQVSQGGHIDTQISWSKVSWRSLRSSRLRSHIRRLNSECSGCTECRGSPRGRETNGAGAGASAFQSSSGVWISSGRSSFAVLFQLARRTCFLFAGGARSTAPYVSAAGHVLATGQKVGLGVGLTTTPNEEQANEALERLSAAIPNACGSALRRPESANDEGGSGREVYSVLKDAPRA